MNAVHSRRPCTMRMCEVRTGGDLASPCAEGQLMAVKLCSQLVQRPCWHRHSVAGELYGGGQRSQQRTIQSLSPVQKVTTCTRAHVVVM
jgi:hypothetical protein